jgi:hypothetical protein
MSKALFGSLFIPAHDMIPERFQPGFRTCLQRKRPDGEPNVHARRIVHIGYAGRAHVPDRFYNASIRDSAKRLDQAVPF